MTTMLERAARAVSYVERRKGDAFDISDDMAVDIARAVLMAVREFDMEVSESIMQSFADPCWPEDVKLGFTAMIDAILSEGEK